MKAASYLERKRSRLMRHLAERTACGFATGLTWEKESVASRLWFSCMFTVKCILSAVLIGACVFVILDGLGVKVPVKQTFSDRCGSTETGSGVERSSNGRMEGSGYPAVSPDFSTDSSASWNSSMEQGREPELRTTNTKEKHSSCGVTNDSEDRTWENTGLDRFGHRSLIEQSEDNTKAVCNSKVFQSSIILSNSIVLTVLYFQRNP